MFRPSYAFLTLDGARLAFALFCIAFFSIALVSPTDPDYWWHMVTGRLIAESGSVPQTDPFSFTAEGRDWVAHEWLSEVLIYTLQEAGGYAADVIFFGGVALASLVVAYRIALSFGVRKGVALVLFGWAGMMSSPFWMVRPQVFTWFLFAWFLAIILAHRRGSGRLWVLAPLMALWANLHLGYAFGLGLVALYALSLVAERLIWRESRELKPVALTLAACVAATMLTPNPLETLLYPLDYLRPGNVGVAMISEWQSPNFHAPFNFLLGGAILLLAGGGVFSGRRDLFLPLLALASIWLALYANRNLPVFAIVFLVASSSILSAKWGWATGTPKPKTVRPMVNLTLLIVAAAAAAIYLSSLSSLQLHSTARVDRIPQYPVHGAAFIRENYSQARIFNLYGWGGFLIHELTPQKVFVDGRSDMYGDVILQDYVDVVNIRPEWADILDSYGVDVIIIPTESYLAERLSAAPEAWELAVTGNVESVFVRRDFE